MNQRSKQFSMVWCNDKSNIKKYNCFSLDSCFCAVSSFCHDYKSMQNVVARHTLFGWINATLAFVSPGINAIVLTGNRLIIGLGKGLREDGGLL